MKDERFFWGDLHPVCVLRGLLYNLWVLILAVLTAWLCVEGYHLFTYHPVYTASATVAVNVKGGTSAYTSLDLTARMAQVFASVFQSDTFREAAQCDVVASVLPETNLINVQVTAENPRESFLSLKNVLENHADLTDELFSNAELRVIRDPQVPLAPSNPVDLKPYRMAGLCGCDAGCIADCIGFVSAARYGANSAGRAAQAGWARAGHHRARAQGKAAVRKKEPRCGAQGCGAADRPFCAVHLYGSVSGSLRGVGAPHAAGRQKSSVAHGRGEKTKENQA